MLTGKAGSASACLKGENETEADKEADGIRHRTAECRAHFSGMPANTTATNHAVQAGFRASNKATTVPSAQSDR